MKWLAFRVALFALALGAGIVHQDYSKFPDPLYCLIVSSVIGALVFAYLSRISRTHLIDKVSAYSFIAPFFPRYRYPLQQFIALGYFLIVFGAAQTAVSYYAQHKLVGSAVYVLFGVVLLLAVWLWLRFHSEKQRA
jgi:hypothetical protein